MGFLTFYKEINLIFFIAFKVNLFFNCLMSEQYYLYSKLTPCLEGAAQRVCAVLGVSMGHAPAPAPLVLPLRPWLCHRVCCLSTGWQGWFSVCLSCSGFPSEPHLWCQCKSHWLVLQQGWTLHRSPAGRGFSAVRLPQLPAKGCSPLSLCSWQAPSFSCGDKTSCVYKGQKFNG